MRILLIGANGLIGSAVRARLTELGHDVIPVTRRRGRGAGIVLDIGKATSPENWLPHLKGVEAVVNCAGVLQNGPGDSASAVHLAGASALFAACERAGIRRVVHVSALGADRARTGFTRTKLAGEDDLRARDLDWVVLRPAVVVGRAAYGGSALFRALAMLPLLPEVKAAAPLQIVQLDDLVAAIVFFLDAESPSRLTLDVVGPDALRVSEVVQAYQRWSRKAAARTIPIPAWLWRLICRGGDVVRLFGWRAPINSTLGRELVAAPTGDGTELARLAGITPTGLSAALAAEPASVQEHWFARLYLLKPILIAGLAFFWLLTGVIALTAGFEMGRAYLVPTLGEIAGPAVVAGAVLDILVGALMLFRRTARAALWAANAVSLAYLLAATFLIPDLWLDPLGALLKVLPLLLAQSVALAILPDR